MRVGQDAWVLVDSIKGLVGRRIGLGGGRCRDVDGGCHGRCLGGLTIECFERCLEAEGLFWFWTQGAGVCFGLEMAKHRRLEWGRLC